MHPAFDIRPAVAEDTVTCRTLLPDAFPAIGRPPELLVAHGPDGIAGAAAVAWVPNGFPVLLHVATPWRRRGIGRALLEAAAASVRGETRALRSWGTVAEASPAAGLLRAAGFAPTRRFLWFETGAAAFETSMTRLLDRLHRRVPADGRVVTLAEAPKQGVVRLVAPGFAALPHDVAVRLMPGARNGFDPALSLVVLRGEAVVGAMLCRAAEGALRVEVNIVAPGLRGGWVNLVMLEAMARRGRQAGFGRFRFGCEPDVRDTIGLARRSGATALPEELDMRRAIPAR